MKKIKCDLKIERGTVPSSWTVPGGCLDCGGDLRSAVLNATGVENPSSCHACGREFSVVIGESTASVRRPYGCEEWTALESSNLEAVGALGRDLLVRFLRGGVYRYAGAADLLPEIASSPSKGKFFATRIKPLPAVLLCCIYGCTEAAYRERNQVMCRAHLDRGTGGRK